MQEFTWVVQSITFSDVVDILIVALVFYGISFLFRGTQAVALFRGVIIAFLLLLGISSLFRFQALGWLLASGVAVFAFAIPVIFQPELRRAFERLGRGSILFNRPTPQSQRVKVIQEIVKAAEKLSDRRHGALIVLQRNSNLDEYIRTGIMINGDVTAELLLTIFWPKTELHDGAVIIGTDGRITSATSVLPLSASRNLPDPKMGTRHRSALGISEVGDAICVVVSEETGKISISNNGRLITRLEIDRLNTILNAFYGTNSQPDLPIRERLQKWFGSLGSSLPEQHRQV